MAIAMIVNQIRQMLNEKSQRHSADLVKLGKDVQEGPLSGNIILMSKTPQVQAMATIFRDGETENDEFIFYFDRMAALLIQTALDCHKFKPAQVTTPLDITYSGLKSAGVMSAVIVLRGGSCLEIGLKRTIHDCPTGRMLIQSNYRTGEPELHYLKLFPDIAQHETVLLLDPQVSSGGSALMAAKVLIDHGVAEEKIVFVTCLAGRMGVKRLLNVFPRIRVVAAEVVENNERRWIEERYLGC